MTLLRLLGQALVGLADRRDAHHEQRLHRALRTPVPLSPYLRRDLGLPPEPDAPNNSELK